MARNLIRKPRATIPTRSPTRPISTDMQAAQILLELANSKGTVTRSTQCGESTESNNQPVVRSESTRITRGKQRAKENRLAHDEEASRVASSSATREKRPLKRVRTAPAVEPSDRVLRSRQARATHSPPAPTPPSAVEATEMDEEEHPRKRARTVASVSADRTMQLAPSRAPSELETSDPSEGPETATHKRVLELKNDAQLSLIDREASPSEADFPYRIVAPPPRVRLMGPGMDPYSMF